MSGSRCSIRLATFLQNFAAYVIQLADWWESGKVWSLSQQPRTFLVRAYLVGNHREDARSSRCSGDFGTVSILPRYQPTILCRDRSEPLCRVQWELLAFSHPAITEPLTKEAGTFPQIQPFLETRSLEPR